MQQINARGTFVLTKAALEHLRASDHAHVLTLSPPLSADPKWLKGNSAYTLSKMGMTMLTLGLAADEAENGIGANCLWPRTIIATAAVQNLLGGDEAMAARPHPRDLRRRRLRDPRAATRASAPATPTSTTRCWPRPASPTSRSTRRRTPSSRSTCSSTGWGPSAP